MSICCILCNYSFILCLSRGYSPCFASRIIQGRCFIERLQARPYKGIALPTLIHFWSIFFVMNIPDIVKFIHDKGSGLPTFVAPNLQALSPVTFNSLDVSSLLHTIKHTQAEVSCFVPIVLQWIVLIYGDISEKGLWLNLWQVTTTFWKEYLVCPSSKPLVKLARTLQCPPMKPCCVLWYIDPWCGWTGAVIILCFPFAWVASDIGWTSEDRGLGCYTSTRIWAWHKAGPMSPLTAPAMICRSPRCRARSLVFFFLCFYLCVHDFFFF